MSYELLDKFLNNRAIFKERRKPQEDMMRAIWDGLQSKDDRVLTLVEAGTGTGKSLAELVPFLVNMQLRHSHEYDATRAIVATASKSLQSQLVDKDLAMLRQHLSFSYTLAKGRNNYLCNRKVDKLYERIDRDPHDDGKGDATLLGEWKTTSGDFADLEEPFDNKWKYNCENCVGKSCQYYKTKEGTDCHYLKIAGKRRSSNVVVTNHHLLCFDLFIHQRGIFGPADIIIIDEAHKFEECARSVLKASFNHNKVRKTADGLSEEITSFAWNNVAERAKKESAKFFGELAEMYPRDRDLLVKFPDHRALQRSIDDMQFYVQQNVEPYGVWPDEEQYGEPAPQKKLSFLQRISSLQDSLHVFHADKVNKFVYYVETKTKRWGKDATLVAEPLSVAPHLQSFLFNSVPRVVMTSATLSENGEDFNLLKNMTGAHPDTSLIVPPVFDFKRQAMLYIPRGLDMPKRERGEASDKYDEKYDEYLQETVSVAQDLIEASGGGCFVLTTSYKDLKGFQKYLEWDGPVFVQGEMDNAQILEQFRQHDDAVLIGTKAFWEGVDVAGKALRLVIITRVPFTNPQDPWYRGINDLPPHEGGFGGQAFWKYAKPKAFQDLRQAFGRAIRTLEDFGVIALLDSRVYSKSYGKELIEALPETTLTDKIEDVDNFFCKWGIGDEDSTSTLRRGVEGELPSGDAESSPP